MIQLPAGATQERTQKVLDQVTDYYLKNEKANVESVFTVNGFSFSGQHKRRYGLRQSETVGRA